MAVLRERTLDEQPFENAAEHDHACSGTHNITCVPNSTTWLAGSR